jgi:superfamily II DNA/RNA helicase
MEHRIISGYGLDPNIVSFQIFHKSRLPELDGKDIDFVIFDEAQEFFDKGLYEAIEELETKHASPRMMLLYDTEQAIVQDYKDIDWYADFIQECGFVHYNFSVNWRCAQNVQIQEIADGIRRGDISTLPVEHQKVFTHLKEKEKRLDALQDLLEDSRTGNGKFIILVESGLMEEFRRTTGIIFKKEIEELTDQNVHIIDQKVRFTTPIMFRGLESDRIALITSGLGQQNRTQNYIGITRAIHEVRVQVWD